MEFNICRMGWGPLKVVIFIGQRIILLQLLLQIGFSNLIVFLNNHFGPSQKRTFEIFLVRHTE